MRELGLPHELPTPAGRRDDRGHRRLARGTQPPPLADQGRHPLRDERQRRRGHGAVGADDLQVRPGRRSLRRRQGRHSDRPLQVLPGRTGAADAPLHGRTAAQVLHRPGQGRAGAGLRHRRAGDGLDRRHLLPDRARRGSTSPPASPASRSSTAASRAVPRPPDWVSSSASARPVRSRTTWRSSGSNPASRASG